MKLLNVVRKQIKGNSPLILTAAAAVGTVTTGYFAAKGAFKASEIIREDRRENPTFPTKTAKLKNDAKLTWKFYIPAVASGATTIVCVVGANRLEVKKTIAAQTALAVSQKALSEYKEQVVKEVGKGKAAKIKEAVAEEKVKNNPPPSNGVLVAGPGDVLCCELYTGRYFTADVENLRKAVNELNSKILKHDYASMDEFYYLINLKQTTNSGKLGWKSHTLMELDFSFIPDDSGRPCAAFDYNYVEPL